MKSKLTSILFNPDLSEEDIKAQSKKIRPMTTGFTWYDMPEVIEDDQSVFFSICFHQNKVFEIRLCLTDDKYGTCWDDWTKENELLRKDDTEALFESLGYPIGKYDWGEVMAVYDPKSCEGKGIIRL